MTGVRLVSVGLQLMAVWLVLMAIQGVSSILSMQKILGTDGFVRWWAAVPGVIFLSFGAILWFFSVTIAKKLYPAEKTGEVVQFTPEMVVRVGCCLLGLWSLCSAMPSVSRFLTIAILRANVSEFPVAEDMRPYVVSVLVQFAFALFLVFGNRTIYRHTLGRQA